MRRWYVVVVLAVASLAALVVVVLTRPQDQPLPAALAGIAGPLRAAGCTFATFESEGRDHLRPDEPYSGYRTVPALSGPHSVVPAPAEPAVRSEQPPVEHLVHNLEHGYVVIWSAVRTEDFPVLIRLAATPKVIVTPITYAKLPGSARVAVTGWQQRLLCDRVDEAVLGAVTAYLAGPGTKAPEPQGT